MFGKREFNPFVKAERTMRILAVEEAALTRIIDGLDEVDIDIWEAEYELFQLGDDE